MGTTVTTNLDALEEAANLLHRAADIIEYCHPESASPPEMRYHALMLERICNELRKEIFGKVGQANG
jgi:hypothetical protein